MKIKKYIVVLMIALITATSAFFPACKSELSTDNNSDDTVEVEEKNIITSFETYDEVVEMRMLNYFGKAQLTGEHATDGEKALKVTVNGDYRTDANPTLAVLTDTDYLKKKDFKDVDKLHIDVYNDNETAQTVYASYLVKKGSGSLSSSEIPCTIEPKTASTLTFDINRNLINSFMDLSKVMQVRISFDHSTEYNQPYRVFYLDNFRYSVTDEPIDKNAKIREDDEIESCEKKDYLAAWTNINNHIYAPSTISYNTNPQYVKQGKASFKVTNIPNYGTTGTGPTYNAGWKISPKIKDMRDYYSYSFWIYNDWHEDLMLRASYHYSFGVNYPAQGSEEIPIKAKDWTYVEVTTEHIIANGVDPTYFNWLSVSVWVPRTESCSFYFDAVYLNKTPAEHKDFVNG